MLKKNQKLTKRAFSINKSVLIPFILLFVTTVSVSSLLFYKTHRDSIENQVALYQELVLKNSTLQLESFMEKPHLMNASMESFLKLDPGLLNDLPRMRLNIINYLNIFTTVMAGGLGIEENGNFIAAGRHINGGFDSAIHQSEISPAYFYYKLDETGTPEELLSQKDSYDVKSRLWYKNAAESGKASWSTIYTFAGRSGIGLTAVLPIYQESKLMGVLQSAFSLNFITDFLSDIPMKGNHRIFVYDDSGYLIGASGNTKIVFKDENDKLQRVGWENIEDPIIQATHASGALSLSNENGNTVPFFIDKKQYYLRTSSYSGKFDLDWTIAIADIKDDFTAEVDIVLQQNIIISVLAAIFFLILGIAILRSFIRPIQILSKAVSGFPGDYKIIEVHNDGPIELRELSKGFYSMSKQISSMMNGLKSSVMEKTRKSKL